MSGTITLAGLISPRPEGGAPAGFSPGVAKPRTVPLPRSLQELQQAAALQFRGDGKIRLYKDGKEIYHAAAVADIKPGDVITVKVDKPRTTLGAAAEQALSTHQADFLRPPSGFQPPKPTMTDDMSTLTTEARGHRLEGQSCYAADFQRPAIPKRHRADTQALQGSHFLCHAGEQNCRSAYSQQFCWPDAKPAAQIGSDDASVLTAAFTGHRFETRSSYSDDFAAGNNSNWKPEPLVKPAFNDYCSTLTDATAAAPFVGQSSYADHYVKHTEGGRQPMARPARGALHLEGPFAGSSEYRRQFLQEPPGPAITLNLE